MHVHIPSLDCLPPARQGISYTYDIAAGKHSPPPPLDATFDNVCGSITELLTTPALVIVIFLVLVLSI